MRGNGGIDQRDSNKHDEKWSCQESGLKGEMAALVDELNVG